MAIDGRKGVQLAETTAKSIYNQQGGVGNFPRIVAHLVTLIQWLPPTTQPVASDPRDWRSAPAGEEGRHKLAVHATQKKNRKPYTILKPTP